MSGTQSAENNQPIDAVITWVNGNDPEFLLRMEPFLAGKKRSTIPGAHPTRFATINEIRYCILSILTFAPFVRKIFIVTAGQDPEVTQEVTKVFPERADSIRIVDHQEIFRGFEAFLPTFSSRAIESMIWRIEGLADQFVYFNDDTFLIRDIAPQEWFVNKKPVLRGRWAPRPFFRICWYRALELLNKKVFGKAEYFPRPSFHLGQWQAASQVGFRFRYFPSCHSPHALNRKRFEDYFLKNRQLFEKNLSYRFRHHHQFNPLSLIYHLELKSGNNQICNFDLAYLQPHNRPENYLERKLKVCAENPAIKFMCVQSLELCQPRQQQMVFQWLEEIIKAKKLGSQV